MASPITAPVMAFAATLKSCGYCLSERLLHTLCVTDQKELEPITNAISDVLYLNLNWAAKVKNWTEPTGESTIDHLMTMVATFFGKKSLSDATQLPCGHVIPEGSFPLERYTACPFCGKPFETADFVYTGQGSKLTELGLFTDVDMQRIFISLLKSPTPLDATQKASLDTLLKHFDVPKDTHIEMKEIIMMVVKSLISHNKGQETFAYMKTPNDILRYLWYQQTGLAQIVEPRTIIAHSQKLYWSMFGGDYYSWTKSNVKEKLKLKYPRKTCRLVAQWMNAIGLTVEEAAENMNPKRGMWVRMIHALRLGEYSRKQGYEHLAEILDVFYKQEYSTYQGRVNKLFSAKDVDGALELLKQRPGTFARCLFATMLRLGAEKTVHAFDEVTDKLPMRLLLSLGNAAEIYFDTSCQRYVKTIISDSIIIPPNPLLNCYSQEERDKMVEMVKDIYGSAIARRFAKQPNDNKTMYIDPQLFQIPISVGDRTATIQDASCALMGTRFPVEGDNVRVFLQWGKGLPAQHLDMDLSCVMDYGGKRDCCSYYNLTTRGAQHSGDIQSIPDKVGTAEYIELHLPTLSHYKAKYVAFTCNAYTDGALEPNMVVGWMNSKYPMRVSNRNGVAYDPSCVQHMVRVSEGNLDKGLVFGVLDVEKREIIWLEMPFTSQWGEDCDGQTLETLVKRLEKKMTIGDLLTIKAIAQHLELIDRKEEADEAYTYNWAMNPSDVAQLMLL